MTEKQSWMVVTAILVLQFATWPLMMTCRIDWGHWLVAALGVAAAVLVIRLMRTSLAPERSDQVEQEHRCPS